MPVAVTRDPRYKWVALSNTTLGALMAVDRRLDRGDLAAGDLPRHPPQPARRRAASSYLLWTLTGYQLVTAVLVVAFGRLGDLHGRVRMYNAGLRGVHHRLAPHRRDPVQRRRRGPVDTPTRLLQGVGGACLFANSAAIITDAFPSTQRGVALGINGVAVHRGPVHRPAVRVDSSPSINWRLVFFVSVPIGIAGTIWAYLRLGRAGHGHACPLRLVGQRHLRRRLRRDLDRRHRRHPAPRSRTMGWTNPFVAR